MGSTGVRPANTGELKFMTLDESLKEEPWGPKRLFLQGIRCYFGQHSWWQWASDRLKCWHCDAIKPYKVKDLYQP